MTGVIYARYSSDNQREESIEGQIRENTAFAEKNGIRIIEHYIDRAISAKTDNRPEFQRMIKDSAKKKFDVVIVWKLDRFSRNRYDSAKYKAILKKNDVKVISATETISEGAEGIILESVLEGMAEYYSADLSEKIKRGMTENALKCKYNGCHIPLGFRVDEEQYFHVDEEKAPIVVEIYERYAHGETTKSIADDMNRRGIKTAAGKPFTLNFLINLLSNRMFIGEYHYAEIVIPHGIPAIVSEELFEQVQTRIQKNKRTPAHNKAEDRYILSTKLFCGRCHAMMVGESGRKNGVIHRYYKCSSAKRKKGCDKKSVRKEWIEDIVLRHLISVLNDEDTIDKMADEAIRLLNEDSAVIPALEAQLKEVRKSIANIMKAVEMGIVTKTTKARLEELEAEEDRLETEILTEENKKPQITKEQILFTLDRFRSLDLTVEKNRERLIDSFVKSVILNDDHIIITTTFKNEPLKIMTKEEVQDISKLGSDIKSLSSPETALLSAGTKEPFPLTITKQRNGNERIHGQKNKTVKSPLCI